MRRVFAILVNLNVDPNALFAETVFVRKKLLEAVEATKLIGQRARLDAVKAEGDEPLQLYRLKHEVLSKQKLDRAFYRYELLEERLLLPRHAPRVLQDLFLERGRFENAYVRQVMGMLRSCCADFGDVVVRAWTLRERLHRDICMNRRFLENRGIDVVDVKWDEVLHWGYQE